MYRALLNLKKIIKRSPVGNPLIRFYAYFVGRHRCLPTSAKYWDKRYLEGGDSGYGSYGKLAEFKAEIINKFVSQQKIHSIIEMGCGDGNQLRLAKYNKYMGFDVSEEAVRLCRNIFLNDPSKQFYMAGEYVGQTAELSLSLDVIYHLIEDQVFFAYMDRLFSSAGRFVIIYSSDKDHDFEEKVTYVKHRKFSRWIKENLADWQLIECIQNPYPYDAVNKKGSFADFYIYQKI